MRIEEMSAEEYARALGRDPIVIIPIGATEAHGSHLPLGTDSYQPEAMADMIAARVDGLVAPMVRYGHHSSTRNMPGTISIQFDTLRSVMKDILESLIEDGVRRFVIVSGHAGRGHMTALRLASEEVVRKHEVRLMLLTDYDLAWELSEELGCTGADGHGGLVETSRVMAIRPDLVGEERGHGRLVDLGFMVVADPERIYPDGYAGPADRATGELGRKINEHIVERLVAMIREEMG